MSDKSPKLVLGDDGSPPSDRAWQWVTPMRGRSGSSKVATADTDDEPIESGRAPQFDDWTPPWSRREVVSDASSVRFLKVRTDPRVALAESEDVGLIVLGLRTHSYLEAWVTGSTTVWNLHHPPAPLIVAVGFDQVETLTLCADGSAHSRFAFETFTGLPFASESKMTVAS